MQKKAVKVEIKPEIKKPTFETIKELNRPKFNPTTFRAANFTRVRSFGGHR